MSTTWIRVAYGPLLALLLGFTVIFGVAMVSPGPTPPADPGITFEKFSSEESRNQNQLSKQIDGYFADAAKFRQEYPPYQRNVFLATAGFGILFALIGLALPVVVNYLRWGVTLGALFLFVYGFTFALRAPPRVAPDLGSSLALLSLGLPPLLDFAGRFAQFALAFIGLILVLFLGLWRLTEWHAPQRRPAPATASSAPAPAPWTAPVTVAAAPSGSAPADSVPTTGDPPTSEWRRPD